MWVVGGCPGQRGRVEKVKETEQEFLKTLSNDQLRLLDAQKFVELKASLTPEQLAMASNGGADLKKKAAGDVAGVFAIVLSLAHNKEHPGCVPADEAIKAVELLSDHTLNHMDHADACAALVLAVEMLVAEVINRHGSMQAVLDILGDTPDEDAMFDSMFLPPVEW